MRRVVFLGVGVAALVVIAIAGIVGRDSSLLVGAQPSPPTPPPGEPGFSGTPPQQARPPFYIVPAAFRGKVVHSWFTQYAYSAGGVDLANGRPLTVEAWIRFTPGGVPELYHSRATYEDGSFYQEFLASPTEATTVTAPEGRPTAPDGSKTCVIPVRGDAKLADLLRSLTPMFVDQTGLASTGFRLVGSGPPTRSGPTALPMIRATPLQVFGDDTTIQRWVINSPAAPGASQATTFEVGANGRVQLYQFQQLDPQGEVLNEVWTAAGRLEVYDPAVVPPDAFNLSREGCQ